MHLSQSTFHHFSRPPSPPFYDYPHTHFTLRDTFIHHPSLSVDLLSLSTFSVFHSSPQTSPSHILHFTSPLILPFYSSPHAHLFHILHFSTSSILHSDDTLFPRFFPLLSSSFFHLHSFTKSLLPPQPPLRIFHTRNYCLFTFSFTPLHAPLTPPLTHPLNPSPAPRRHSGTWYVVLGS